jgi:hypothetical protein
MEEEINKWIFFEEIDWEKNNRFSIDTRDFSVIAYSDEEIHPETKISKIRPTFYFTKNELVELITRLFNESGGKVEWRMLDLNITDNRVNSWRIKYIRIWKTDNGYLVCNSDNISVPKRIWEYSVNKKYLNAH